MSYEKASMEIIIFEGDVVTDLSNVGTGTGGTEDVSDLF